MGITDRRYMGHDEESFGTLRGHSITAILLLILINVGVWIVWQFAFHNAELMDFMRQNFLCGPSGVLEHLRLHTLITCAFSHQDTKHILFNMITLYVLGPDLEHFYGKWNLIALYIFAAVIASLGQIGLEVFRHEDAAGLGASGSVMGIAIAAAFVDPQKPISILGVIPLRLWMLAALYVILDVTGAIHPYDNTGHGAHLGGAFAGFIFYKFDLRLFKSRGREESGLFGNLRRWWRSRKFRVIQGGRRAPDTEPGMRSSDIPDEAELVAARRARKALAARNAKEKEPPVEVERERIDPETAKRVDELLDKISRYGLHALNNDEREFLRQSSQKYRR